LPLGREKEIARGSLKRISDVAVQQRYRARLDSSRESDSPSQVRSISQIGEEAWSVREVVAVVGVGNQHVMPARGFDAGAPYPREMR
jgi:hypothetical protein